MEITDRDRQALGGSYILMEVIGKGSFGVVFKAVHKAKGYFVAVKKLAAKREQAQSLKNEIKLLQSLSDKHVVRYNEHLSTDAHVYIVMEYIENGSLSGLIKSAGVLPESLVRVYTQQLLKGLVYLHGQGVIHRDIKGANLLICTDGTIKLTDFGVSIRCDLLDPTVDNIAGTPNWMAPEIIEMRTPTPACDIWSVGATIIELLTGNPPFWGMPQQAAIYKIVMEDHPPLPPGISSLLEYFLLDCFKKDENLRSTAAQLLDHRWMKSGTAQPDQHAASFRKQNEQVVQYNQQMQTAVRLAGSINVAADAGGASAFLQDVQKALPGAKGGAAKGPKPIALPLPLSQPPQGGEGSTLSRGKVPTLHFAGGNPKRKSVLFAMASAQNPPKSLMPLHNPADLSDMSGLGTPLKPGGDTEGLALEDALEQMDFSGPLKLKPPEQDDFADTDDPFGSELYEGSPEDRKENEFRRAIQDTIVANLNRLGLSKTDEAMSACQSLLDIFNANPQEALILIQPSLAAPFSKDNLTSQLPMTTLLALIRFSKGAPNFRFLTLTALRLLNCVCRAHSEVLAVVCVLQGIPYVCEFAKPSYPPDIRLEVGHFVLQLCIRDPLSLLMSSNSLETIDTLLQAPNYEAMMEVVHIGLDCLAALVRLPRSGMYSARLSFCEMFTNLGMVEHMIELLAAMYTYNPDGGLTPRKGAPVAPTLAKSGELKNDPLIIAIDVLVHVSSLNYHNFNKHFTSSNALGRVRKLLEAVNPEKNDVNGEFLLNLLKVIHNVSATAAAREALEPLMVTAIRVLVSQAEVSPRKRAGTEIINRILHFIYNMCTLSAQRTTNAAVSGLIPVLHRSISENWPMKELTLPVFFSMPRTSKETRKCLWENKSICAYLELFKDNNWFVDACVCVSQWLSEEPQLVWPVLRENYEGIRSVFTLHGNKKDFPKALPPVLELINDMNVASLLITAGTLQDIRQLTSNFTDPVGRLNLLKIYKRLLECASQKVPVLPRSPRSRGSDGAREFIDAILQSDSSHLVRQVAEEIRAIL
eukprot:m51a1_g10695 putative protein serine threonine kinase (1037) ;mRNA; r:143450-147940